MIKEIAFQGRRLALIVFNRFQAEGVHFFTPDEASLQLAYMHHAQGKVIATHVHNDVKREITATQEVFVIRRGRVRVDFYNDDREYLESQVLSPGDVLLQVGGGHGFEILEELEMIEIKQGPYVGAADKTRFVPAPFATS